MSFNPDSNKEVLEVIFSRKLNKSSHPDIFFNNAPPFCANCQKHIGMRLRVFNVMEKISKAMKGIGIIQKLSKTNSLVTRYKSFVRPNLDDDDIFYDQPNNESFNQKIERIQYNATLSITGAIKGKYQNNLYRKLGFESLKLKPWFRKLCSF